MTRIIAGSLRSLSLEVPAEGTRPTTDRVREALFSALESRLDFAGIAVADFYAGSGALGLEAMSRGASTCDFVDSSAPAARVLDRNCRAVQHRLGLSDSALRIHRATLPGWVAGAPPRPDKIDLVFIDPPYAEEEASAEIITRLVNNEWLSEIAFVVVESSARAAGTDWPAQLQPVLSRSYGETRIEVAEFAP